MGYYFNHNISDWASWGQVFRLIEAFESLIKHIFLKENLKIEAIEQCTPGTNAVFKVGNYIVKIYAPKESGIDADSDYDTEIYGMKRADELGIPAPKLICKGTVNDTYSFKYIVMEYIEGKALGDIEETLSNKQKEHIGITIRNITDKLNQPSNPFNSIDIIKRELSNKRWNILPDSFNQERTEYLNHLVLNNNVYVHGDLNPDNVLVDQHGSIYIIDFADALLAPQEYELPAIICELFCFDKAFIKGFLGVSNINNIVESCLKGLLIHDFGANIISCNFGNIDEITSINELKKKIYQAIESGKQIDSF